MLFLVFIVYAALSLVILFNKGISIDEIEHIHSAWYIENGFFPYADFFQHHNPLLWYLILPLLNFFGHGVEIILIVRVFMFVFILGVGGMIFLIGKRVTGSKEAGLLSIILLFSQVMFVVFCFKTRPDIPQMFFGLVSVYFLLTFFHDQKNKYLVYSGLAASCSFLFLQKTVFLLFAYGIILLYYLLKRKILFRSVVLFSLSFLLPVLIFLLWLAKAGALDDYFLTNWLLNLNFAQGDRFSLFRTINYYILKDIFFWLFTVSGIWTLFRKKDVKPGLQITAVCGIVMFLSLFMIKRPWGHHFMFSIALFSIPAGYFLRQIFLTFKIKEHYRLIILILVLLTPSYFLVERTANENKPKIERARYVLQNSTESDCVYDGKNQFNLFRPDLHYFWFSLKKNHGLDTYNRIKENTYSDYDVCRLIKEKRPKFISDFQVDMVECGLDRFYEKTKFDNLYIRIEGR